MTGMKKDLVEKVVEQKPPVLRRATGTVNGTEVELELKKYTTYIISCGGGVRYRSKSFFTKFFANRYFDKLKKKYGLKEEGDTLRDKVTLGGDAIDTSWMEEDD